MGLSFENRVALVTGGSGGIGRELCAGLAAQGAAVAVAYSANPQSAQDVVRQIDAAGGTALALGADLSSAEAPLRLLAEAEEALGPIDILVNNAGLGRKQELADVTVEDFDQNYAVNLRTPFLLTQRALPGMISAATGACSSCRPSPPSPAASWARSTPPRSRACTASRTTWRRRPPRTA